MTFPKSASSLMPVTPVLIFGLFTEQAVRNSAATIKEIKL
jgi:hypothetical protein